MQLFKHKRLTTFILSLAVLIYAMPRLSIQWEGTLSSWFAFIWLGFAVLVVAANLRFALGVDRAEAKQMERIERLKRWQREEWIRGSKERYPRGERRRVYHRDIRL